MVPVSGFPLPCLKSCRPYTVAAPVQELLGSPKFFDASLPACHGLRTPADLSILAQTDGLVLPSVCVKTLGVRNKRLFEAVPALQGARSPLRPPGYSVYASPILFAVSPRLRHGRKTRYGWVPSPYPTGTFTLQETPSLSWRDHAGRQARLKADARHERTLEAVACTPLFGTSCGRLMVFPPRSRGADASPRLRFAAHPFRPCLENRRGPRLSRVVRRALPGVVTPRLLVRRHPRARSHSGPPCAM